VAASGDSSYAKVRENVELRGLATLPLWKTLPGCKRVHGSNRATRMQFNGFGRLIGIGPVGNRPKPLVTKHPDEIPDTGAHCSRWLPGLKTTGKSDAFQNGAFVFLPNCILRNHADNSRPVCRPPQAVLVGALTPLRSAAKQGRRQEPCTIHLTLHPSRPRFPAAVLLRLKRSWVKQQNPQKAGQDHFLTSKVLALARPIHGWLCHQQELLGFAACLRPYLVT